MYHEQEIIFRKFIIMTRIIDQLQCFIHFIFWCVCDKRRKKKYQIRFWVWLIKYSAVYCVRLCFLGEENNVP